MSDEDRTIIARYDKPDRAAELVALAFEAMDKAGGAPIIYLHRNGKEAAQLALVSCEWIGSVLAAQSEAVRVLINAPDTSSHDHVEPGMWDEGGEAS